MSDNNPPKIPVKYRPQGFTILYEDRDMIVINKNHGLLSMGTDDEKEKTAYSFLSEYVKKGNSRSRNRVFIVHRLDRETSGVIVYAKDEKSKRYLQDNWADFSKTYYAVVEGEMKEKSGSYSSYLKENKAYQVYSVPAEDAEGKFAETSFEVVKTSAQFSLVQIQLHSGRKHQIRVHFSENGHALLGDKIYGKGKLNKALNRLALHAGSLTIKHPFSHKEMTFVADLPHKFSAIIRSSKEE